MNETLSDQELRAAIIAQIEEAFDGVERDDGVTLHEARELDDYGSPEELAAARAKDTESRWQDIPESWIDKYADTLPFMDVKGFRYYIPAFMIWALKHYDDGSGSFADDAALYAFGVGESPR